MLETHHDEFFDLPPHSYSCVPPRFYFRALSRTSSRAFPQFAHEPNHRSYSFGYGPCPPHGDRFPRMPSFSAGGSYTHLEPRHLNSSRFPHRGSRPTWPSGEV
jgi:hypothetical protein